MSAVIQDSKIMNLEKIIDDAYALYMPQIRSEITQLAELVRNEYGLTPKSAPYNILEIGTKYGGTFHIWSSINQSSGMNISIDVSDGGRHGGISEEEMDKRDLWFYERFDNVHFVRGDSHSDATKLEVMNLLNLKYASENVWGTDRQEYFILSKPIIDVLFIDGDHTKEGVKQDFLDYEPFCKKDSIICFHDINDSPRHRERDVFVSEFWKELNENENDGVTEYNGKYYRVMEFNAGQDWAGIGILIKK